MVMNEQLKYFLALRDKKVAFINKMYITVDSDITLLKNWRNRDSFRSKSSKEG